MKTPEITYRPMRRSEIRECAELAARAFHPYEYFTNYFPESETRMDFMKKLITTEFATNFGRADYLVGTADGKIVAVADLRNPQYKDPSVMSYLLHGFWRILMVKPFKTVSAWLKMDEQAGEYCHRLIGGNTWYVSLLTISPEYQGQGIGSNMLMNGIIPYIREHNGKRMCFFTNSTQNLHFYQKLGFEVTDEREFVYDGHTMGSWSFVRSIE